MTEASPHRPAPILIDISADVPLRILRAKNGFVIDVGDLVQIRGISYDQVADFSAGFIDEYVPGDPFRALVDAAQAGGRAWARGVAGAGRRLLSIGRRG
jgi:hypothetical protein